jgi:predicted 3-demethylubiquinone-9 3-methyltransferase (glyoxalase superfamily)
MVKNVICLWYNGTAEEAAKFYAQTFPDSRDSRPSRSGRLSGRQTGTGTHGRVYGAWSAMPRT